LKHRFEAKPFVELNAEVRIFAADRDVMEGKHRKSWS
jgi:hypothetical protein